MDFHIITCDSLEIVLYQHGLLAQASKVDITAETMSSKDNQEFLGFSFVVSINAPCLLLIYFVKHQPSDLRRKEDSLDSIWLGLLC